MKDYISYPRWNKKEFEGTIEDLNKYFENTYMETVDNWFGSLDMLNIGEQMDNVILTQIIKRKGDNLFILYSMTTEALIRERGLKPLKRISHEERSKEKHTIF